MTWLAAAGQSSVYVANFGHTPAVVGTFAVGALLALAVAGLVPHRRSLTASTGLSLALVLAVTVVPSGGWGAFAVQRQAVASILANLQPRPGDLTAWASAGDGPLNVVLFVPLGLSLALLLRRPVVAAGAAAALSLAIECYQSSLTTRVGAFADVVANTLGAGLGAAAAAVVLVSVPALRRPIARLPRHP